MTMPPKQPAPSKPVVRKTLRKPKVRNYTKGPVAKLGLTAGKHKPKA